MSTGGFEDDSIQQPPQAVYVGHISPKINSRDKLKKALGEIGLDPDIELVNTCFVFCCGSTNLGLPPESGFTAPEPTL
jgi:hypothetical protein